MTPISNPINLILQIDAGKDADAEELDGLTRQLLMEMQELEVESVELVKSQELPEGAKAGELVTLGSLAVAVLPTVFPKLIEFLQSWSLRAENRMVKIKTQVGDRSIEVEYSPATMSTAELKRVVKTLSEALPLEQKAKPG